MELKAVKNALCLGKKAENESDWVTWNIYGLTAPFAVLSFPILEEQGKCLGKYDFFQFLSVVMQLLLSKD